MTQNSVPPAASTIRSSLSVLESADANEYAGLFEGWNLHMDQMSSGPFSGRLSIVRLPGIELIREITSQTLMKQGAAFPKSIVLGIPLAASNESRFNGRLLSFPTVLLSDGDNLPALMTSKQLDVVSIAVNREKLFDFLDGIGEKRAADFIAGYGEQQHFLETSAERFAAVRDGLRQFFNLDTQPRLILSADAARDAAAQAILQVVAAILPEESWTEDSWTDVKDETAKKRIVERIREYVMLYVDDPPSIVGMCRHVGISRRTLQS